MASPPLTQNLIGVINKLDDIRKIVANYAIIVLYYTIASGSHKI